MAHFEFAFVDRLPYDRDLDGDVVGLIDPTGDICLTCRRAIVMRDIGVLNGYINIGHELMCCGCSRMIYRSRVGVTMMWTNTDIMLCEECLPKHYKKYGTVPCRNCRQSTCYECQTCKYQLCYAPTECWKRMAEWQLFFVPLLSWTASPVGRSMDQFYATWLRDLLWIFHDQRFRRKDGIGTESYEFFDIGRMIVGNCYQKHPVNHGGAGSCVILFEKAVLERLEQFMQPGVGAPDPSLGNIPGSPGVWKMSIRDEPHEGMFRELYRNTVSSKNLQTNFRGSEEPVAWKFGMEILRYKSFPTFIKGSKILPIIEHKDFPNAERFLNQSIQHLSAPFVPPPALDLPPLGNPSSLPWNFPTIIFDANDAKQIVILDDNNDVKQSN